MPIFDWEDEYKKKIVSADEAINVVKSGNNIAFAHGKEPLALGLALAARKEELKDIKLIVPGPGRDFPWYEPGWEDSFQVTIGYVLPAVREMIEARRGDYLISGVLWAEDPSLREKVDVLLIELSPPDKHGFCSFGASLWNKKKAVQSAKIVIAEVNQNLIKTYGENFVHFSEIDYFVEHPHSNETSFGATDLLGRKITGPGEVEKIIAERVASLVKDGDTLEIGVGGTSEWIAQLGVLDNKLDLGWHSENTPKGIATLVRNGVVTGKFKKIHQGKAVATAVGGGTSEEISFIDNNPLFELYSSDHVLDPRVIAAHDHMVAINSAVAVDLTGQIAAESIGHIMISGTGGQLAFAIGSMLSNGGKNITALPSTAKGGTLSRIVPRFEPGTIITVPRNFTDYVVTEYGVVRLRGKTQRERAKELISIAHPQFAKELMEEAAELF